MIIVAIGWLYVVIMIAAVSDTLLKGVVRLLFLGVLPVGLLLWIKLRGYRARTEAAKEEKAES
jgi:type VI protein secretion system component VasK